VYLSPTTTPRWLGSQRLPRSGGAVGLVELMVVLTIISMVLTVVAPSYQRIERKARMAAIVNDFRVYRPCSWPTPTNPASRPVETPAGIVPSEVKSNELKGENWTRVTPMGGEVRLGVNQIHFGTRYRAAIAISETVGAPLLMDLDLLQELDRVLDDGNLDSGNFRLGFGNCPLLILEP